MGTFAGLCYSLNKQVETSRKTVILLLIISTFIASKYISMFLASLTLLSVIGGIFGGFIGKMICEKMQYKADIERLEKLSRAQSAQQYGKKSIRT